LITKNSKQNVDRDTYKLHTSYVDAISLSQRGVTRSENQDRCLIKSIQKEGVIAVVADGMGGESSGDVAAQMAILSFEEVQNIRSGTELDFMKKLFKKTDKKVLKASCQKPLFENMGTTLIAVAIKNETAYWTHVGDSRLFLFRKKSLKQITQDQTFAKFLLDEGEITQEQALTHYSQHILDQCIGHGECEPETGSILLKKNDVLLLSTDGLHKTLDQKKIETILNSNTSKKQKASKLLKKTVEAKGNDDITVLLLQILQ
jgi:serine/threonine protein phosphatase PrpC